MLAPGRIHNRHEPTLTLSPVLAVYYLKSHFHAARMLHKKYRQKSHMSSFWVIFLGKPAESGNAEAQFTQKHFSGRNMTPTEASPIPSQCLPP